MKVIEVEIDDKNIEELQLNSDKLTYSEFRKQIARAEARKALLECQQIAKENQLDEMNEEDIQNLVREVRAKYGKNSN